VYYSFVPSFHLIIRQQQTAKKQESKREISLKHTIPDSVSLYHLRILDSAVRIPAKDTMYHCRYNSIDFRMGHGLRLMLKVTTPEQPVLKTRCTKMA
jgi:hypothetical protein